MRAAFAPMSPGRRATSSARPPPRRRRRRAARAPRCRRRSGRASRSARASSVPAAGVHRDDLPAERLRGLARPARAPAPDRSTRGSARDPGRPSAPAVRSRPGSSCRAPSRPDRSRTAGGSARSVVMSLMRRHADAAARARITTPTRSTAPHAKPSQTRPRPLRAGSSRVARSAKGESTQRDQAEQERRAGRRSEAEERVRARRAWISTGPSTASKTPSAPRNPHTTARRDRCMSASCPPGGPHARTCRSFPGGEGLSELVLSERREPSRCSR